MPYGESFPDLQPPLHPKLPSSPLQSSPLQSPLHLTPNLIQQLPIICKAHALLVLVQGCLTSDCSCLQHHVLSTPSQRHAVADPDFDVHFRYRGAEEHQQLGTFRQPHPIQRAHDRRCISSSFTSLSMVRYTPASQRSERPRVPGHVTLPPTPCSDKVRCRAHQLIPTQRIPYQYLRW